ncbi:hypothetical protein BaRGS_00013258 [Batillaria attramentaria]|uniref:Secreted protein n=1 Tax=Batillaria attramentaria TaxID=370345 RepID=A0ABD0L895_9CAEN
MPCASTHAMRRITRVVSPRSMAAAWCSVCGASRCSRGCCAADSRLNVSFPDPTNTTTAVSCVPHHTPTTAFKGRPLAS